MLSTLTLLQSINPIVTTILRIQYQLTRVAILTACLIWFYCYTVPVECFLMAESLLVQVAGYNVPQWSERKVVRFDTATDEVSLLVQTVKTWAATDHPLIAPDLRIALDAMTFSQLRSYVKSYGIKGRSRQELTSRFIAL